MRATEKTRKALAKSHHLHEYNDDDPPIELPGDSEEIEQPSDNDRKTQTCPHYRQLTAPRIANMLQERFAPSQTVVNCCSAGGEKTQLGAMDIEDLVAFGVNPYKQTATVYRDKGSFRVTIAETKGKSGCRVHQTRSAVTGIKPQSRILKLNGKDMRNKPLKEVTGECNSSDVLELEVLGPGGLGEEHGYSGHSACPYYLSRALAKHAEIVFTPYNYLLDPAIREAIGIDLTDSVVVLDEAHNVEDTLRESGSGKFGEFELCELLTMLEFHSREKRRQKNDEDDSIETCDLAHALLLFLESVVRYMRNARHKFETNSGKIFK